MSPNNPNITQYTCTAAVYPIIVPANVDFFHDNHQALHSFKYVTTTHVVTISAMTLNVKKIIKVWKSHCVFVYSPEAKSAVPSASPLITTVTIIRSQPAAQYLHDVPC